MRDTCLPVSADGTAPDGSVFRRLLVGQRGQLAHFELAAGCISRAVVHRHVEELWYVLAGHGELWRADADGQRLIDLQPGTCADIGCGVRFQFRAHADAPLQLLISTMPPWPGDDEAQPCAGYWPGVPEQAL